MAFPGQFEPNGTISVLAILLQRSLAEQARAAYLGAYRGKDPTIVRICSMPHEVVGDYGPMALESMKQPPPTGKSKLKDPAERLAPCLLDATCLPPGFNIDTGKYATPEMANG